MINTSLLYRQEIRQNTKTSIKAKIVFKDNTELEIGGDRFILGTTTFDESTSASDEFEIGSAITKSFNTVLNNYDGYFDKYDFMGARIIPTITKELSNETLELIGKGTYYIEKPNAYGNTISLNAKDKMHLFDTDFSNVNITYPATLLQILNAVCTYCNVVLETQEFTNANYVVNDPIETNGVTCRDVVASIAQLATRYARFANTDYLQLKWYDTHDFSKDIDGGSFNGTETPYIDGHSADGGSFGYNDGDSIDGGYFTDKAPYQIYAFSKFSVNTDDVVITGIKAVKNEESYMFGTEDYCLEISNIFLTESNLEFFAKSIGNHVIGLRFRPFSVSAIGDPSVEAGDSVVLVKNGQNYYSFATHITYKMSGYETFECGAKSAMRNKSEYYSATTKKLLENQNAIRAEKTARELAVEQLAYQLANANGLYMTTDVQPDGSTIYYMHNKPTLAESMIVWKMTATALGISTDGGQTYPYGLDVSGNAILNRIYAIGLDADYIRTGALTVDDGRGNILFNADFNKKEVTLKALENYMDRSSTEAYIDVKSNQIMSEVTEKTSLFNSERNLILGGTNLELDLFNHSEDAYVGIRFGKPCIVLGDGMFFTETPYLSTHLIIGTGTYKFEFEAFVSGSFEADEVGTCVITVKDSATQNIVEEHTYRIGKKIEDERVYEWRLFSDNITVDRNCDVDIVFTLVDFAEELRIAKIELVGGYENLDQAVTSLTSFINQTASNVSIEVSRAKGAEEALSSAIDINATEISAKVSKSGGSASSFGWSLLDNAFSLFSGNKTVFKCDSSGITINGYTKTDDLQAKVATFGYATVAELNAQKARIDTINSNYISASSVASNYATIGSLNASNARISSLEADHVSVGTINSMNATIRGKLTTSNLASEISSLGQVTISSLFKLGDYMVRWQSMTVKNGNGQNVTIRYLGR